MEISLNFFQTIHISSTFRGYSRRLLEENQKNHITGRELKIKIRYKLFFTILLTSSVVACGLFFFLQWNFDRGFLNYVNNQEMAELEKLEKQLLIYYSEEGSWEFMRDNHHLWIETHMSLFGPGHGRPRPGKGRQPFGKHEPPPMAPHEFGQRIILFDADKQLVIGGGERPEPRSDIVQKPISYQSRTIGYLGLIPATKLSRTGDLLFVEQQTEAFAAIALAMVVLSILLSFPVTIHLLRPINHLTDGTRKLINSQFATRIPVTTGDELGRLCDHFNILAQTLEENEKARKRWIADISHELRTPLAVVRGEVEAMQDGVRELAPMVLEPLHGEILHLQRLVDDLYELSMSDIGALSYKKIPVNPVGILKGTIELFEQRFLENRIEIQTKLPTKEAVTLLGDPDRLQQLFENLFENSLRYTKKPGILKISAASNTKQLTLKFQDSAPGVEQDQLPLIFDRFFRTDPSRQRAGSGAGLGLAICVNIVEAHQGIISAHDSPFGGLGITMTLPLTS